MFHLEYKILTFEPKKKKIKKEKMILLVFVRPLYTKSNISVIMTFFFGWHDLKKPKRNCGLDYKDLRLFNLTILVKYGKFSLVLVFLKKIKKIHQFIEIEDKLRV